MPLRYVTVERSCTILVIDTSHFDGSLLNDVAYANILAIDTSHFDRSLLNEVAPANIAFMVVSLDTSHFEMSLPLDTSHFEISRCWTRPNSNFAVADCCC